MANFIPYTLPDLPYDYDALEPVISKEIMELHYSKHHKTYVANLNVALEKYLEAEKRADIQTMIAEQSAINFNGGGHINHSIFWTNLTPEKKRKAEVPHGDLAKAIQKEFGSFENFMNHFKAKTIAIQGSGWGWLGYCPEGKKVLVATCANQDPLSTKKLIPLLGIDVWEHAYYLQYKNVRPEYVNNIWRIIDWENVSKRYEEAHNKV